MTVKNIQEVNEAIIILRHFIDLSARLLPILYKLDKIASPTEAEIRDKNKILKVFQSYNFETQTSEVLVESNVIELIKQCYLEIQNNERSLAKDDSFIAFLEEYNRLKNNWRLIENN
jgi:hypothetical protein